MIGLYNAWKLLILQSGSSRKTMVLTSYLDDSGAYEDPACRIVCVAGCVSPEDAWVELEREWKAVLVKPEYNVDYLHMKEFAHSTKGSKFESWKGDESKRQSFLSELMDIIERKVMAVVGATIPVQVFDGLPGKFRQFLMNPLFLCAQEAFHQSSVMGMTYKTKVAIQFSNDEKNGTKLENIYKHIKANSEIGETLEVFDNSKDMRETPALQAADLIAYELHHFAKTLIQPEATIVRVPMKRLFRENYFFTFFDHNSIVKRFYLPGPAFKGQS